MAAARAEVAEIRAQTEAERAGVMEEARKAASPGRTDRRQRHLQIEAERPRRSRSCASPWAVSPPTSLGASWVSR